MRTTTALAVGATALALPAAAQADGPLTQTMQTSRDQMHAARQRAVGQERARRVVHRAHRLARLRHERFSARAYRRRLRGDSQADLNDRLHALRRRLAAAARPAVSPALQAIAACESGGNPATDTGNGFYGKYQFTLQTWRSVGGAGNPADASEAEQDRRAAALYAREGASPWPVCGR
jgi:hypothetical protein